MYAGAIYRYIIAPSLNRINDVTVVQVKSEVGVGDKESGTAAESESGSARLILAVFGNYLVGLHKELKGFREIFK